VCARASLEQVPFLRACSPLQLPLGGSLDLGHVSSYGLNDSSLGPLPLAVAQGPLPSAVCGSGDALSRNLTACPAWLCLSPFALLDTANDARRAPTEPSRYLRWSVLLLQPPQRLLLLWARGAAQWPRLRLCHSTLAFPSFVRSRHALCHLTAERWMCEWPASHAVAPQAVLLPTHGCCCSTWGTSRASSSLERFVPHSLTAILSTDSSALTRSALSQRCADVHTPRIEAAGLC
jgi:hypothetical protein